MPVVKTFTDTVGYDPETYVSKLDTPQRDYLAYGYASVDVQVSNITTGTARDFHTIGQCEVDVDLDMVEATSLEDWTTRTLVENPDFSDYDEANELPEHWFPWVTISGSEIKRDGYTYKSAPASVVFSYAGAVGQSLYMGIAQTIEITDILQTEGIYRLMFYYQSSDANTIIAPALRLNDEDGTQLGVVYLAEQATTASTVWHLYDAAVQFGAADSRIASITVILLIRRVANGNFTFHIDDVDFHYGFDLNTHPRRPPRFPSWIGSNIPIVFDRTADKRIGHITVLGGGIRKRKGILQFSAIPDDQMKNLRAAFAFRKGHRLNVENIWPWRSEVMTPKIYEFAWLNDCDVIPTYSGENLHELDVETEEI